MDTAEARAAVVEYLGACEAYELQPRESTLVAITWCGRSDDPATAQNKLLLREAFGQVTAERRGAVPAGKARRGAGNRRPAGHDTAFDE